MILFDYWRNNATYLITHKFVPRYKQLQQSKLLRLPLLGISSFTTYVNLQHLLFLLFRLLISMPNYLQARNVDADAPVTPIFEFDNTFIENLTLLPNGRLLLTIFGSGNLFPLDPEATDPKTETLITLDGSTGLSGIAALGGGKYTISGGIHTSFNFQQGSMKVYVVSLPAQNIPAAMIDSIPVPDTRMMNGMAAPPIKSHIILSADSLGCRILRVDTSTREAGVVFADAALNPSADNPTHPLGINGLRIEGHYLYFSRFPIDDDDNKTGNVEIIARLEGDENISQAYDDFAFDGYGNTYIAMHPSSVNKISPDGKQATIAGNQTNLSFREPTSVVMAKDS